MVEVLVQLEGERLMMLPKVVDDPRVDDGKIVPNRFGQNGIIWYLSSSMSVVAFILGDMLPLPVDKVYVHSLLKGILNVGEPVMFASSCQFSHSPLPLDS